MYILCKTLSGKNNVSKRITGHTTLAGVPRRTAIAQRAHIFSTLGPVPVPPALSMPERSVQRITYKYHTENLNFSSTKTKCTSKYFCPLSHFRFLFPEVYVWILSLLHILRLLTIAEEVSTYRHHLSHHSASFFISQNHYDNSLLILCFY